MTSLVTKISRSPRKLLQRYVRSGGTVLDLGCGDMRKSFDYVFDGRRDIKVVGIEKYIDATIYGESQLPEHVASSGAFSRIKCDIEAEPLPFNNGSIDAAYCSHVFEHLQDPSIAAKEVYRVLRSGGHFYVEVPGPRATLMPKDAWITRQTVNYPLNHWNDGTHVLPPFSTGGLERLLTRVGFEVVRIGFHREFGVVGMPLYAAMFAAGILPWPSASMRSTLLGAGWWNLVGWPLFAIVRKP